ncbi:hypothetical protein Tco_0321868 [Tanacetum coccineum]
MGVNQLCHMYLPKLQVVPYFNGNSLPLILVTSNLSLNQAEDMLVIVKKLLVLEMIVDESLEMIEDESLEMIVDETLKLDD